MKGTCPAYDGVRVVQVWRVLHPDRAAFYALGRGQLRSLLHRRHAPLRKKQKRSKDTGKSFFVNAK